MHNSSLRVNIVPCLKLTLWMPQNPWRGASAPSPYIQRNIHSSRAYCSFQSLMFQTMQGTSFYASLSISRTRFLTHSRLVTESQTCIAIVKTRASILASIDQPGDGKLPPCVDWDPEWASFFSNYSKESLTSMRMRMANGNV